MSTGTMKLRLETAKYLMALVAVLNIAIYEVKTEETESKFIKTIGNLKIEIGEEFIFTFKSKNDGDATLISVLGQELKKSINSSTPRSCDTDRLSDVSLCIDWNEILTLEVLKHDETNFDFKWANHRNAPVEVCFEYKETHWYGGPEYIDQQWPAEKLNIDRKPYITRNDAMGIAERYWLLSNGLYITIDDSIPLFIDSNNSTNGSLCFTASGVAPYKSRNNTYLTYRISGKFKDVRQAHEDAVTRVLGKPSNIPDIRMVKYPVWSTWVKFLKNVDEDKVLSFANNILKYGFNNSQLEIDDDWETCYGSVDFNLKKFPNVTRMNSELKRLGFRVTLWVHPFVNSNCSMYSPAKDYGFLVENSNGTGTVDWWDGSGGLIDFTKTSARDWFLAEHRKLLTENNLDGLKFDSGEAEYLPENSFLNCSNEEYPNCFTQAYVTTVSKFGKMSEVRVGYRTQSLTIYLRMLDKDSVWGLRNGLRSLVTTLLLMNVQGYLWVLPDMVGGNQYGTKTSKELFIRWLQANTFMPVIQFSLAPWDFDEETIQISRKFMTLHYQYSGEIVRLMAESVRTGAPLNPPIWWVDPTDLTALEIDSEYMLGEDILVAPVLEEGAISRDIYLPRGSWADGNDNTKVYEGRNWLRNFTADLQTLPYFVRVTS